MEGQKESSQSHLLSSSPLMLLVLFFVLLFLSSFLSSSATAPAMRMFHAFGLVKSGWDAFNIFLVIFAILCGVLSRNADNSPRRMRTTGSYPELRQLDPPAAAWDGWRFSDNIHLHRSAESPRRMRTSTSSTLIR